MRTITILLGALALLTTAACGDDSSGGDASTDTGADTTTPDTGTPDTSVPDTRPPMDSGMDSSVTLPVAECDPFGDDCAEGEKCAFVIYNPDAESTEDNIVFYGCVSESTGTKAAGIICNRGIDGTPDNPDDVFQVSDCAQGHFCWNTLDDSFERCRPMCGLEGAPDCADEEEFCLTLNSDPPLATCNPLSDCDPIVQTGCDAMEGCYIVGTTQGDLGARCFDEPTADDAGVPPPGRGDDCMFINGCRPGLSCSGEILDDGGVGDMALCREFCEVVADGGMPIDGGECMTSESCVAIPLDPDGGTSLLPRPTGLCQ
jgi:hypothetical protein